MIFDVLLWFGVLVLSLAVLIKSSDWFTASAEMIGLMFGISPFVVGVTIVSIGTSLPELVSSVIAVYAGASEIVAGNVIGSNVANIFLILGTGAVFGRVLQIRRNLLPVDLPMLVGSAFFLAMTTMDGVFSVGEGVIFLGCLIIFFLYLTRSNGRGTRIVGDNQPEPPARTARPFLILVGSSVLVFVGAKFTVDAVIRIAELLQMGTEVVAVSAVALGTSLPELAVTVSAVRRKNTEIVIGNVLGSNIFNTYAVMGVPALLGDLVVPESLVTVGLPALIAATLLFLVVTVDRKVTAWEGWLFYLFYVYFIGKIFNLF